MNLSGLHLLLTYQCTLECDHCFAWGSPWQSGTMTLQGIRSILTQAETLGTVRWIYFEGGEPFLYYAVLLKGVQEAASMGFQTGIVSNGYWATAVEDALEWLRPFAGLLQDLSISSDLYHWSDASGLRLITSAGWYNSCVGGSVFPPGGYHGCGGNGAGANNLAIAEMSLAVKPAGLHGIAEELLFAIWIQFGPTDSDCATVDDQGTLGNAL